jgi:hypothetical protein
MNGIATTISSWNAALTRGTAPPRATFTRMGRGATFGQPQNNAQQRRILEATLALLEQDAPLEPVRLREAAE